MANGYKFCEKTIGNDVWHIHYARVNDNLMRVTCELLRPNRKSWQSRILWRNWAYIGAQKICRIESVVDNLIGEYYLKRQRKKKSWISFLKKGKKNGY